MKLIKTENDNEYVNDDYPIKNKPLPSRPDDTYLETTPTFKFIAIYQFDSATYGDGYLSLEAGDELIGYSNDQSGDWIEVHKSENCGRVPSNYIELCQ